MNNQLKDFGYCAEAAKAIDAAIPGTLLLDELLQKVERAGNGELTTAVLYESLLGTGAAE